MLLAEKNWEGCGGLHLTDEIKLTIAAEASLLLLGVPDHDYFARVKSVVVYPDAFLTPQPDDNYEDDELSEDPKDGQAWYHGAVVLGWRQTLDEARHPDRGVNVVIHEFAHQLDFQDGETNGTPPLGDRAAEERWRFVMTRAFERHRLELNLGTETFSANRPEMMKQSSSPTRWKHFTVYPMNCTPRMLMCSTC